MTDEQAQTIVGAASQLGRTIVSSLPAQFLALLVCNTLFLITMIWFLNQQDQARERMLTPIVAGCMQQVPGDVLKQLLETRPAAPPSFRQER